MAQGAGGGSGGTRGGTSWARTVAHRLCLVLPGPSAAPEHPRERRRGFTAGWMDASWGRRAGAVLPPLSTSRCTPAWGARDAFLGSLPSPTWRQSRARQGAGALQQQSGSLLWLLRPCAAFLLLPSHQHHVPPNAALGPQPCEPPWVFSDAPEPAPGQLGMRDHLSSFLFLG